MQTPWTDPSILNKTQNKKFLFDLGIERAQMAKEEEEKKKKKTKKKRKGENGGVGFLPVIPGNFFAEKTVKG